MPTNWRDDLHLVDMELTGETRPPREGEFYLYGVRICEADATRTTTRVILRLKNPAPPAVKSVSDLFRDLPPREDLWEETVAPTPTRYET